MAKVANPLEYVNNLAKEHNIPEELTNVEKLTFLNAQIDEFKKVIWRHQVDVLLSEALIDSDNPQVASEGALNKAKYTAVVKQMAIALGNAISLREEIAPLADAEGE